MGETPVGSGHPISIQSMLNRPLHDEKANIRQGLELKEAGCDLIRVAVSDAESVSLIPALKKTVKLPVIADIQYDYRLAVAAAESGADKIRLNPGNIGGDEQVRAVVAACKKHRIPIRIGVNSGSLGREILQKYGRPCAEGLAESALSQVNILEKMDFGDYLVSLKSSDAKETVEANRLFAEQRDCPLHLGVTEAGTESCGVLKSAAAIGSLLLDGIGDTIRISLSEDPVKEVSAARNLLKSVGAARGIRFVSCPTCGRCRIDLFGIVRKAEKALQDCPENLTVAIMGCAVNGPGEASDADIGLAGGRGELLLFAKGKPLYKVKEENAVDALVREVARLSAGE